MTPAAFTFKLTVPRDPAMTAIVSDVASHAVNYAEMNPAAGAELVGKVAVAAAAELTAGGTPSCPIIVTCADGELRLTIGSQTISQKIAA